MQNLLVFPTKQVLASSTTPRLRLAEARLRRGKARKTSESGLARRSSASQNEGGIRLGFGEVKPAIMNYVYILKCNDSRFYVDRTSDLRERLGRHKKGQILATKDRLPIKLNCCFAFNDKYKGI